MKSDSGPRRGTPADKPLQEWSDRFRTNLGPEERAASDRRWRELGERFQHAVYGADPDVFQPRTRQGKAHQQAYRVGGLKAVDGLIRRELGLGRSSGSACRAKSSAGTRRPGSRRTSSSSRTSSADPGDGDGDSDPPGVAAPPAGGEKAEGFEPARGPGAPCLSPKCSNRIPNGKRADAEFCGISSVTGKPGSAACERAYKRWVNKGAPAVQSTAPRRQQNPLTRPIPACERFSRPRRRALEAAEGRSPLEGMLTPAWEDPGRLEQPKVAKIVSLLPRLKPAPWQFAPAVAADLAVAA